MRWVQVRHLQPPPESDLLCYYPDGPEEYLVLTFEDGKFWNVEYGIDLPAPTHWALIEKPK